MRKGRVRKSSEQSEKVAADPVWDVEAIVPVGDEQTARLLLQVLRAFELSPSPYSQEGEKAVRVLTRIWTKEHVYVVSRVERARIPRLTPRQTEIVTLVAEGLTNKQIATRLPITKGTLSTHMRRLFARLGVRTRGELAQRVRPLLMS